MKKYIVDLTDTYEIRADSQEQAVELAKAARNWYRAYGTQNGNVFVESSAEATVWSGKSFEKRSS